MTRRRTVLAWLAGATVAGPAGAQTPPAAVFTDPDDEAFDPAAFPYPVVTVPGERAVAEWERLRTPGRTPIVIGANSSANRLLENLQGDRPSPAEILRRAANLRFPEDRRAEVAREEAEGEAYIKAHPEWADHLNVIDVDETGAARRLSPEEIKARDAHAQLGPLVGEWPVVPPPPNKPLAVAGTFVGDAVAKTVHIVLLPTSDPTEAPAYLNYGGWNECPSPEQHVAAFRHWRDAYGAVPVSMGGDIVEMKVARRPRDRAEALALARDQHVYCRDIVDQGAETLSMLAAILMAGDWWFFWWD